ncbi:MAG: C-type lectin domain-containing protein [Selenomonadaceae bacterium]|nr:C-type lectin domain-containing protein [Selenomonadaceae bacterium]
MATTDSWATITSSSRSTILPDSISTVNGTNNADTIRTKPIDHTVRAIYGNSGNDLIDISGNYGILWSESTIKGGNGKDSIYIHADIDGIHPATVTIDSGADSDIISIYGGYQGVHGGTVGMKNRSSVSINSGTGNDTVFIRGGEKGIDISNVKISGGAGNDLISIQGGKYGIGGVSGYGNATVQIDGGNGADTIAINSIDTLSNVTITAGSGDVINVGSGNADYFFDSTGEVTINGAVFKSNSADTSAKIKTSSNSITLSNGWNGEVKIANGIKLTDSTGKVINNVGSYSIINGKINTPSKNLIPSEAYIYNKHSYYIYSNVADTWEEAQAYCEARGGHLAVINDAAENTALFNYMKDSGYNSAYFGLSDAANEGTWTWVNGDSSSYRNWETGEPNNESSNEDYASINSTYSFIKLRATVPFVSPPRF